MQKRWNILRPEPELQAALGKALNIPPLLAQLLINRGLKNAKDAGNFIRSDISCLHDPMLLPDMKKAVLRIKKAIKNKEKVLIFGDYDADGVTSCALLQLVLEKLGLKVNCYIPHRIKEGYGINKKAVIAAKKQGIQLFISVDCGITNSKEIELLNSFDIDSIIVDHHEPQDALPKASAIINPKIKKSKYPFKDLAAVGIVYKLCQKLSGDLLIDDLDIVTLGTIADVAPLIGENRILVREGLAKITQTKKTGLQKLIKICNLKGKQLNPFSVGFILGPRINAAGRVNSADISFRLLVTSSEAEAEDLAEQLNLENKRRQEIQRKIFDEALAKVEQQVNFKDHNIIILDGKGWHRGVLGIIASRIMEKFYRPAIVISREGRICKGSARSIKDFHIFDALSKCESLLEDYGGHSHAAGITILGDNIEEFRLLMNKIAKSALGPEDLIRSLDIDAEIAFKDISFDLISSIDNLAPFGKANPCPVFSSTNLSVRGRPSILGRGTLKFWVTDGQTTYSAVGFGMSDMFDIVANSKRIDLAYTPSIDSWQDRNQIQLNLEDIRPSSERNKEVYSVN